MDEILKPSEALYKYLSGEDAEASEAIKSWARFPIFQKANSILKIPKERRLSEIEKTPEHLRLQLKAEITRLHNDRQKAARVLRNRNTTKNNRGRN